MLSELSQTAKTYSLNTTQATAVDHCLRHDHTLLVADKGAGKTRTGLAIAAEDDSDTIIICPNKVRLGWIAEGKKIGVPVTLIAGTPKQRKAQIAKNGIRVMGVDLVKWLCEEYKFLPCDSLILDETTRYSSPGSVGVKKLRRRVKGLRWTLGLTASPVMEAPLALYGQCLVLDGGEALGRSYEKFKQQYFYATDYQEYDWQLREGAGAQIAERVKDLIYIMEDKTYEEELVALTEDIVYVEVPPNTWNFYQEICEELMIEVNGVEIEAANQAVVSGKLEQLTQGAVYDDASQPHWIHYAKFDELQQMLDADLLEPTIVVYQFIFELVELRARFPWGRDLKDPGALEEFTHGRLNLLFMHPKSGSHGINAQARCCEMICLKPIWSADAWDQIIGRIRRRGQTRDCRRRTLVVKGSIDEVILDRVAGKENTGNALLEHIKLKARKI